MELVQALANGVMLGGVYALISVGLTLIFGVMSVVNFAHAEFFMLGMFVSFLIWQAWGIDPLISAPIVGILVFLVGMLLERLLIEPIIHAPPIAQVMATVGLSLVLQNGASLAFGNDFRSVFTPYQTATIHLAVLRLSAPYFYAFLYATFCLLALYWFLYRTDLGQAIRATAQNRNAAALMGISARRTFMLAFGLGVGLAGLAGSVILPYTTVFPTVGTQYVLIMFTVVVLGGLTSIRGTLAAALAVGVIQSVSATYLSTQLQNLAVFAIFYLALVVFHGKGFGGARFPFTGRRRA